MGIIYGPWNQDFFFREKSNCQVGFSFRYVMLEILSPTVAHTASSICVTLPYSAS